MTDVEGNSGPSNTLPQQPSTPALQIQGHWVLLIALGSAVAAAVSIRASSPASPEPPAAAVAAPGMSAPAPSAATTDSEKDAVSGTVLERLDVPKYTYLRLNTGAGETWAAVASSNVKVGESVRVVDAQLMTAFVSTTLKRTFDRIYFGALADGSKPAAQDFDLSQFVEPEEADDPHAGVPGAPPIGGGMAAGASNPHSAPADANPHGASTDANPHAGVGATSDKVVVGRVAKAEGKNGRRVAELFAQRKTLKDQTVRVRGVVVKVVSGVLDRSFVHLRDGSENAEMKDLVVTTQATPAVGDHVLFEGKVTTDKDFGAGYVYPVLLEDATAVSE